MRARRAHCNETESQSQEERRTIQSRARDPLRRPTILVRAVAGATWSCARSAAMLRFPCLQPEDPAMQLRLRRLPHLLRALLASALALAVAQTASAQKIAFGAVLD